MEKTCNYLSLKLQTYLLVFLGDIGRNKLSTYLQNVANACVNFFFSEISQCVAFPTKR